jgi:hypothetical protein
METGDDMLAKIPNNQPGLSCRWSASVWLVAVMVWLNGIEEHPKDVHLKLKSFVLGGGGVSYNYPLKFPVPAGGISLTSKSNICLIE